MPMTSLIPVAQCMARAAQYAQAEVKSRILGEEQLWCQPTPPLKKRTFDTSCLHSLVADMQRFAYVSWPSHCCNNIVHMLSPLYFFARHGSDIEGIPVHGRSLEAWKNVTTSS